MRKYRLVLLCIIVCLFFASCYIEPDSGHHISPTEPHSSTDDAFAYSSQDIPDTNFIPSTENRHVIGDYFPSDGHNGLYKGYLGGTTLSYYDFDSESLVSLCPQQGCAHQDATCVAYQGELMRFGIYDNAWYCLVAPNEHTIRLQKTDPTTNHRIVLWEIKDQDYIFNVGSLTFSSGKVWFDLAMTRMSQTSGELDRDSASLSEHLLVSIDMESHSVNTFHDSEGCGQYRFWGGSEMGYALTYSVLEEELLTCEEYMQENPDASDSDYADYLTSATYLKTKHRLYYHDNTSDESTLICENVRMGDLNNCYDDQLYYRSIDLNTGDSTIYQLDLNTGQTTAFWEDSWILNYTALDNKLICVLGEVSLDDGGLYYVSLDTKEKGLIENNGYTEGMYFSLYGETHDRFIGITATGMRGWIFKTDYWAGNYDAIVNLPW